MSGVRGGGDDREKVEDQRLLSRERPRGLFGYLV